MKKFFFILLIFISFPCLMVHGQTFVVDAAVAALLEWSHVDQAIYYGQQLLDNIQSIENTILMVENTGKQLELAMRNFKTLGDINDWDDFMDWYNRQLYLERKTGEAFDNINVTIGKKQYHISQIESMAFAAQDSYVDFWEKEFTEDQRKEMWLGLGLTPSNYAYVQPFREKVRQMTRADLTAEEIQNEEYVLQMQRNKARQNKLAMDKLAEDDKKLGSKEIAMMTLESLMETNKVLNDIAMNMAIERKQKAVRAMINNMQDTKPPVSDWSEKGFEKF